MFSFTIYGHDINICRMSWNDYLLPRPLKVTNEPVVFEAIMKTVEL